MNTYLSMSAWREILARTFDGFPAEDNVSPEWLINPATRRRLKLDRYYPDAGIAIRFVGLTAKGQRRQSDWEALETEQRDQTRAELCRLNGVQLILVDPNDAPVKQLDGLTRTLIRAKTRLGESKRTAREKKRWGSALTVAQTQTRELRALVNRHPEQMMANLAECWRDREAGLTSADRGLSEINGRSNGHSKNGSQKSLNPLALAAGERVCHSHFGKGIVTAVNGNDSDATVGILFDEAGQKTFLASLLNDKIELVKS